MIKIEEDEDELINGLNSMRNYVNTIEESNCQFEYKQIDIQYYLEIVKKYNT